MANNCSKSLKVCALGVTQLTQDGSPDIGGDRFIVDDLITLTVSSEYGDDDDIERKSASGAVCLAYFSFGPFKRLNFTMDLCAANPELHAILVNGARLQSSAAVGFAWPEVGQVAACGTSGYFGVGLEAWTLNVGLDGTTDPTFPYLHWLFPRTFWRVGDKNFENAEMVHSFEGIGLQNDQWLDGPSADWPVPSDRAGQWLPTATLPTAQCGPYTIAAS